jgi:myo-inositol-1(or 4)-monophosphatase
MLAEELELELEARASLAGEIARSVGREASAFRAGADMTSLGISNKGLQDFVTVADKHAEETIRSSILARFPEDGFMGEETGGTAGGSRFWVVDPIDGTTNFIRGFRHWGVSIAYVAAGKVRIGVVYDAALDKVYSATRGGGAFKDGKPIRASGVTDPTLAIAILGHSRRTSFEDYQAVARRLYEMGVDYRRMGAAAIGLVRVADGIADLYYERHLNGWDMLAGALIAREAGAIVHLPPLEVALGDGGPVIAGAAGLHKEFDFLREQAVDLYGE